MSDYMLVTNYWNEAGNIRPLIENIAKQTKRPKDWLFIDDGSPERASDEAQTEIMNAGEDFGILVHYTYTFPMKDMGNKLRIGRAWNIVLPWIKELKADYLGVVDVDNRFPAHYFAFLTTYLDLETELGCVAGLALGEKRHKHMPMGGGKLVRWEVIESIENFWDLAPDTFLNIKSLALGFQNDVLSIEVDARETASRSNQDLGCRLYYTGNSIITALFKTLRLRDLGVIKGFLDSRGAKQCTDFDVRYYYSKRRILKSFFKGKGVMR